MERLSSRANVEGVQGKEMKPERMRPAKKKKKKKASGSMSAPSKENTHKGDIITCKHIGGKYKAASNQFPNNGLDFLMN